MQQELIRINLIIIHQDKVKGTHLPMLIQIRKTNLCKEVSNQPNNRQVRVKINQTLKEETRDKQVDIIKTKIKEIKIINPHIFVGYLKMMKSERKRRRCLVTIG